MGRRDTTYDILYNFTELFLNFYNKSQYQEQKE